MRMRRKPWARPELEACPFYIADAKAMRGRWQEAFPKRRPVHLELGCGKGVFLSQEAAQHPEICYIGVDIKSEVLAVARRNIVKSFSEKGLEVSNVLLCACDIRLIGEAFSERDAVSRIYIQFPNPWPRLKHRKRRLTYPRQLIQYRAFLIDGGDILLRTDDRELFEDSVGYFAQSGFRCFREGEEGFTPGSPFTSEHERMFSQEGKEILRLRAVKEPAIRNL